MPSDIPFNSASVVGELRHPEREIEIVDGAGYQGYQTLPEQISGEYTEQRTNRPINSASDIT